MQSNQTEANSNQVTNHAAMHQAKEVIVNVANKEPATRGVKNVFVYNGERLYTAPEVMAMTNIKARATLDKFIEIKALKTFKRPGRQPLNSQGRGHRMLFKKSAIDVLIKYMQKNSRIAPPGIERVMKAKKVSKPVEVKVTEATPKKTRKSVASKDEILARLDLALSRVSYLTEVVTELSKSVRKETSGSDTTH